MLPAYVRFTEFVRDDYAPKGRTEPGAWALPDGAACYAFRVKESTTTELTPEEIHQLGLAQVEEIEARMLQVVNQLGFKDLKSFSASLRPILRCTCIRGRRFLICIRNILTRCI